MQTMMAWVIGADFHQLKRKNNLVNFQYNISYKDNDQIRQIGFRSKKKMMQYLDANKKQLNKLNNVYLHFKVIKLSLNQSAWKIK